ncbi:ComF family protein [Azonexus sp. R2A61]|uniref:ComF family protein n=1 Tax=Azonexus sp. R2A61 TaxID=2744443 RepID=UPI001F48F661|nr:ComF family protein [Azonexus sp. R2A61]
MSILPHPILSRRRFARLSGRYLPNSCLLCGADHELLICQACCHDLPALPEQRCPQCAQPTTHGERCGTCLQRPPHFASCHAAFRYDFPIDRLIQAFKYGQRLALAPWFATRLAEIDGLPTVDRILPMPLHPSRLRERGFNQAGEMATHLGKRLQCPVDLNSLRRCRPTAHQADLPLNARAANVRGAFACAASLDGLRVLLVDDVLTSGATADECARVLRLHGAIEVHIGIVARALKG